VEHNTISLQEGLNIVDKIVSGNTLMPLEIAKELGFLDVQEPTDEAQKALKEVFSENEELVQRAKATGRDGPLMSLVIKINRKIGN